MSAVVVLFRLLLVACWGLQGSETPDRSGQLPGAPELVLPRGARVLLVVDGDQPDENHGVGLGALGDVDDDGAPDFVVASRWPFGGGEGCTRIYSGASGRVIRCVGKGLFPKQGPPASLVVLGDVDADGARDFGTECFRFGSTGFVRVFSGRTGALLFERTGDPDRQVGSLIPVGDLDRDGHADFFTYEEERQIVSGRTGEPLPDSDFPPICTVDLDGDGVADRADPCPLGGKYVVGLRGELLLIARPRGRGVRGLRDYGSAGDVNGDGLLDVFARRPVDPDVPARTRSAVLQVDILSGRQEELLHSFLDSSDGEGAPLTDVGDWDGDGRSDFVTRHWSGTRRVLLCRSGADLSEVWSVESESGGFGSGFGVLGDLDGDGRPELLVSDPFADSGAEGAGRVYVLSFR